MTGMINGKPIDMEGISQKLMGEMKFFLFKLETIALVGALFDHDQETFAREEKSVFDETLERLRAFEAESDRDKPVIATLISEMEAWMAASQEERSELVAKARQAQMMKPNPTTDSHATRH